MRIFQGLRGGNRYSFLSWGLIVLAAVGFAAEAALFLAMFKSRPGEETESIKKPLPMVLDAGQLAGELRSILEQRREERWSYGAIFDFQIASDIEEMAQSLVPPFIQIRGILFSEGDSIALLDVDDWAVGTIVREGQSIAPDLKVLNIKKDSVDFQWAGQKLSVHSSVE